MKTALILLLNRLAFPAAGDCLAVQSERLVAADLATVLPWAGLLPGGLPLGYAPLPGQIRWLRGASLRALAARHGIDSDEPPDICLERVARPANRQAILEALRASLPAETAIELVDYCRLPVPAGRFHFPLRGILRTPSLHPGSLLRWRGSVLFDRNRSAPFWVSVRLAVKREGCYAVRRIPQGQVLTPDDFAFETKSDTVFSTQPLRRPSEVTGRSARRTIPEGSAIAASLLDAPRAVSPGEDVRIRIDSGATRLTVQAKAINGGRVGDPIRVLNPRTGKQMKAIVEGRAEAFLELEHTDANDQILGVHRLDAATRADVPGGRSRTSFPPVREGSSQPPRSPRSGDGEGPVR